MSDNSSWMNLAKRNKQEALKDPSRKGALYPTAIAVLDGKIWMQVETKEIEDLYLAVRLIRTAMDPDLIVAIMDVYCDKNIRAQSIEEAMESMRGRNLMQEFQRGNPSVSEALSCVIIDRNHETSSIMASYVCEQDIIIWKETIDAKGLEGRVRDHLVYAMSAPVLVDSDKGLEALGEILQFNRERKIFHATRTVMDMFKKMGYKVEDFISQQHLDWVNS